MGKFISWVALGFFVVVVPFISWYYLKQGYNYRKAILSEVLPKDSIYFRLDTNGLLKSKTTVLVLSKSSQEINTNINGVYEQFKNVPNFQIVSFDSISGNTIKIDSGFVDLRPKYHEFSFILVDTAYRIRNFYPNNDTSIKKLIEHIAVILPRQKDADIKMK